MELSEQKSEQRGESVKTALSPQFSDFRTKPTDSPTQIQPTSKLTQKPKSQQSPISPSSVKVQPNNQQMYSYIYSEPNDE